MSFRRMIACLIFLSLPLFSLQALAEEDPASPQISETAYSAPSTADLEDGSDPQTPTEEENPSEEAPAEDGETTPEQPGSAPFVPLCEEVGDLLETEEHGSYIAGFQGKFRPAGNLTRAETAQIFYNLLKNQPEPVSGFSDVPETAWYHEAVCALASLKVINGYPNGTFKPSNSITRAEFVTIAAKFGALLETDSSFPDVKETYWASQAISSAAAHGWIHGYEDGTFRPEAKITRAEAVTLMNNMLGRMPDENIQDLYFTREFSDVSRSYWAYGQICEAATDHKYTKDGEKETWTYPDRYDGTGWGAENGIVFYEDPETGEHLKGFQHIGEYTYYFEPEEGALRTGWQEIDGKHYLLPARNQPAPSFDIEEYLTLVNYNRASRGFDDIKYITVHYTAEPGDTARGECQSFYSSYRAASAHFFVDQSGIWRCVRDRDISWHCGANTYYHDSCRNWNSIGIEMCCRKSSTYTVSAYDDDWYFAGGTLDNTASLIRYLMMRYGIPMENIVRHNDVSHKICPAPYVNDFSAWQNFLQRVDGGQSGYNGSYTARVTVSSTTLHSGPSSGSAVVGALSKGDTVTVLEERGKDIIAGGRWARTPDGWIHYAYISRM